MACFALLDDRDGLSRLYTGHFATLTIDGAAMLPGVLEQMQAALAQGLFAVGLFSYELGAEMQGIRERDLRTERSQVLLFSRCERLTRPQVDAWLAREAAAAGDAPAGIAAVCNSVTREQFNAALEQIHAYIEAGDTYQINYTYRVRFDAFGDIHALYARLRERQPVPYGALIALPDGQAVLSLSPELFVRHSAGTITARPMKGTALASGDPLQDAAGAAALAGDEKNRAENLMIVDLLRNDLGRIAEFGSVTVPALFEVQRFSQVLQMTSTVQARLRADAGLPEVFAALYPCGSITGAPKRRTMQIIRELEADARGFYTGAIGWFEAPPAGREVGDFCLSVPIRTLTLQPPDALAVRKGEMGVGAGIVFDSALDDEYEECRLKARFLTGLPNDFTLFETMHATRATGCRHRALHLTRMAASAAYFGFAFDLRAAHSVLDVACANLAGEAPHRLRLALNQDGLFSITAALLTALTEPVQVLLSPAPTAIPALFLQHKTSLRDDYDAAWRAAEAQGAFDMLFVNARGELTEGARSSLFVKLDGRWYTPPLSCGLLPGVMRAVLLADPLFAASERTLRPADLRAAEEVIVCNALRGALRAMPALPPQERGPRTNLGTRTGPPNESATQLKNSSR